MEGAPCPLGESQRWGVLIVRRIRVKIPLYVVKATMKLKLRVKIRVRAISIIFCLCSYANMAASDKDISLMRKFLRKLLNFMNKA